MRTRWRARSSPSRTLWSVRRRSLSSAIDCFCATSVLRRGQRRTCGRPDIILGSRDAKCELNERQHLYDSFGLATRSSPELRDEFAQSHIARRGKGTLSPRTRPDAETARAPSASAVVPA